MTAGITAAIALLLSERLLEDHPMFRYTSHATVYGFCVLVLASVIAIGSVL